MASIPDWAERIRAGDVRALARAATAIENQTPEGIELLALLGDGEGMLIGITGPPGAGKSSLVDALVKEIRQRGKTVGILAVDPTSRMTGGAIMGDRIRMQQHHGDPGVYIRSMATRGASGGLARATADLAFLLRGAGFDYVLIETVGVGQDEIEIAGLADVTVLVLVPGMGDDVQAIKAGIMEIANIFVINKADHAGADRTEAEIRAEAICGAPILRTVATHGTGVAELLDAMNGIGTSTRRPFAIDSIGVALRALEQALGSIQIHHVAIRVRDFEAILNRLKKSGARLSETGEPSHIIVQTNGVPLEITAE
jgi:LAO/AO transport system kinase